MKVPVRTYIYDNRSYADWAKKDSAASGCDLGAERTTAKDLLSSLWDLWGDGRALVEGTERAMMVYGLLESHGIKPSYEAASQIAAFIGRFFHRIEEAAFSSDALSPKEQSVLDVAREYSGLLGPLGLVEPTTALESVAGRMVGCKPALEGFVILDEPFSSFFSEQAEQSRSRFSELGRKRAKEGAFALLLPEGRSISDRMVVDEVLGSHKAGLGSFAVVSKDPVAQFRHLGPLLRKNGLRCAVKGSIALPGTKVGAFVASSFRLLSMARLHGVHMSIDSDASDWICVASDIAASPYACTDGFDAASLSREIPQGFGAAPLPTLLNSLWRADRTLSPMDAVTDLEKASEAFCALVDAASSGGIGERFFQLLEGVASSRFQGIDRVIETAAASAIREIAEEASRLGLPVGSVPVFAASSSIPASVIDEALPGEASSGDVYFLGIKDARGLYPRTYDEVVLCDVTDDALNSRREANSTDAIAAKMRLEDAPAPRLEAIQAFYTSMLASREAFACVLPLHGDDAQETFPSFSIEDYFEARFEDALSLKDAISRSSDGLGPALAEGPGIRVERMGEEDVVGGIGHCLEGPVDTVRIELFDRGILYYSSLPGHLQKAKTLDGPKTSISPSAIESYLSCPYKWFMENAIYPQSPDEGFGPLESGCFAHEAIEAFYTEFIDGTGLRSTYGEDPGRIREAARKVVDRVLERQRSMPPLSGRYVPCTPSEEASARRLADDIAESIVLEAMLPARFRIAAQEHRLTGDGEPCPSYAGFALSGKADRVDADPVEGSFVVIDYKGSIRSHDAGEGSVVIEENDGTRSIQPMSLPQHVQTLVYAKALLDSASFGERCEGALYTSYRAASADCLVKGSYPAADKEIAALSDAKSSVGMRMESFLSLIEEAVARRLQPLLDSQIPEDPSSSAACEYCTLDACEGRR